MRAPRSVPSLPLPDHGLPLDGGQVPSCFNCERRDRVRRLTLTLHDLMPGIEYWNCDGCGFVWATRNGDDLRTIAERASLGSRDATPFTPQCANCQQSGRTHESPPDRQQHYICAHCHRRWVVNRRSAMAAPSRAGLRTP
jgi:transposase-like protein